MARGFLPFRTKWQYRALAFLTVAPTLVAARGFYAFLQVCSAFSRTARVRARFDSRTIDARAASGRDLTIALLHLGYYYPSEN